MNLRKKIVSRKRTVLKQKMMWDMNIGDEYKDMISKCFKYGLTNGDFYLSNFDNQQLRITNVVKKYR